MRIMLCAVAALTTVGGCTRGARIEELDFVRQPRGADAQILTATRSYRGELIAVEDSGFVLLAKATNRVVFVPDAAARRFEIEPIGGQSLPLTTRARSQVRLLARHPYGITPAIVAALLDTHSQRSLERVQ